jgi:GntR family transcriptional regulator
MDRHSRVPFYVQLKDLLKGRVEDGSWRPGDRLPSEAELCADFDVSRTVVRQALSELALEGLVVRQQGRGSFVARPKINEALVQRLTGFHQDMAERGFRPVSRVLRQELEPASATLARHLGVDVGTPLVAIERLRFVAEEPLLLVTTHIPRDLCPRLLDVDLRHRSLYEVLEQEASIVISRGRRWIEAVAANARQATLLKVEKGAPLIRLESVSYLADGTPVEFYHAIHRSDRARFEVELVRMDSARDGDGRATDMTRAPAALDEGRPVPLRASSHRGGRGGMVEGNGGGSRGGRDRR